MLAGRARQITFHLFDPKLVEDLLDRGASMTGVLRMPRQKKKRGVRGKAEPDVEEEQAVWQVKDSSDDDVSKLRGWESLTSKGCFDDRKEIGNMPGHINDLD